MAETGRTVLHDYWRSSASYRVRIALALKGIAYETRPVDLVRQQHRTQEHLALNPQRLVPVLEIDGHQLTQSLAIIVYLDETRPEPPLLPADPAARHRARALAHLIAMDIHPLAMPSVAARVSDLADGGETVRLAWMRDVIARGLDACEVLATKAGSGHFAVGDAPTVADLCLVPQLYNAARWNMDLALWPRLTEIDRACRELPAFQAAHPDRARDTAGD